MLRTFDDWIPSNLVEHLSPNGIKTIKKTRGPINDENTFIYHYHPFQELKFNKYIKIDENGFRNEVSFQNNVDLVVLGDSIMFARGSEIDVGNLFRKDNISVLNMGMSGFSPQHYRDVYKKYIIDKDVKHDYVLICLFVGNDFNDSIRYPYIVSPVGSGKNFLPWTINILVGAFKIVSERISAPSFDESKYIIELPYRKIGINYLWYPGKNEEMEIKTNQALTEVINLAEQNGAKAKIITIPSPASVYGYQLFPGFDNYYNTQVSIVEDLKKDLFQFNIEIYDPTIELSDAITDNFLYLADSETHFNEYGIKVIYNLIIKNLFTDLKIR